MRKDARFGINDKHERIMTSVDPYQPEEALKGPAVCSTCHAIYRNKRWVEEPEAGKLAISDPQSHLVTCPACRKIADGYPEGIVTLSGDYLLEHEEEIRNILKNEELRSRGKNPLERIMRMEKQDGGLLIETTEPKLAEHLGRTLHRAHQGELQVDWTGLPKVCRVQWTRSLQ